MDDDVEALRRRAYSREGTDEDRRRLAALQAPPADVVVEPAPVAVPPPPVDAQPDPDPVAPPAVRRRRWPIVLAALTGVAVGATAGVFATRLAPEPTTYDMNDSLRVFDEAGVEPPDGVVVPEGPVFSGNPITEIRYLGEIDQSHVFASRVLTSQGEALVCLAATAPNGIQSIGCASEDEFGRRGLSVPATRVDIMWGPTGEAHAD